MSSSAPVTDIGDASSQQEPLRTKPALCLSGGGYRAMLYKSKERDGTYWGIRTDLADYKIAAPLSAPADAEQPALSR